MDLLTQINTLGISGAWKNIYEQQIAGYIGVTGNGVNIVSDQTGPQFGIRGITGGAGINLSQVGNDVIVTNSSLNSDVTLSNAVGTHSLVNDGIGPGLVVKGINQGAGMNITSNANTVTFATDITFSSSGGSASIANDTSNPSFSVRGLSAGAGINVTQNTNDITIANTSLNSDVTLTSPSSSSLITDATGPTLAIRGITGGAGVSVTSDANNMIVTNTSLNTDVTLTSAGGSFNLVQDQTGPGLVIRGLNEGNGINITQNTNNILIENTSLNTDVVLNSAVGTHSLVNDGAGPVLAVKGINQSTGMDITSNTTTVTFATNTTFSSSGGAVSIANDTSNPTFSVRGLTNGTGIGLTQNTNDITITNTSLNTDVTLTSPSTSSLITDGMGPSLTIRGVTGGAGVSVTSDANNMIVTNTSLNTDVTLTSAGGTSLVTDSSGPSLTIKGMGTSDGLELVNNASDILFRPMWTRHYGTIGFDNNQTISTVLNTRLEITNTGLNALHTDVNNDVNSSGLRLILNGTRKYFVSVTVTLGVSDDTWEIWIGIASNGVTNNMKSSHNSNDSKIHTFHISGTCNASGSSMRVHVIRTSGNVNENHTIYYYRAHAHAIT